MAPLQAAQVGDALLQLGQAAGLAVEGGAVAVEVAAELLQAEQGAGAGVQQGGGGGIEGGHLLELLLTGRQVVEGGRRRLLPLQQPPHHGGDPLLETHAMGQSVLLRLQ